MTLTTRYIFLIIILPEELHLLKLHTFNKNNIHEKFLKESIYPIIDPWNSVFICTFTESSELLDLILKECRNQNKTTKIQTNLNSLPNDISCYIVLDMNEINVCEMVLNISYQPVTVIIVNLNSNFTKIDTCISDLYHVKVVYISIKNKQVVFRLSHFTSAISFVSQNNSEFPIDNLKGKLINLATFHYPPFSIIKETKNSVEYDGMEMNLFKEMSTYLNFTWRVVDLPSPGGWGKKLDNGTMVGGIAQALRDGVADIGFCNMWQQDLTFEIMDFGPALNRIYVTFIVRRPYQLGERWQSLFRIFKNDVWLVTSITVIIVSVVFWIGRNMASHTKSRPSLVGSTLIMFGILTNATSYKNAATFQLKLVIVCWFFFTLLFTTALTGSIVTRLTIPLYSPRVDTVEQLVEGGYHWVLPGYHHRRYTLSDFFFNLDNPLHCQLESKYEPTESEDVEEHLKSNFKVALLAQRLGNWVMLNVEGSSAERVLEDFRVMPCSTRDAYTSFGFKKYSPLNKLFTRTMQRFIDHGLWNYWVRKLTGEDFSRKQLFIEKDIQDFNHQPEQLTLKKLHPVFYLLLIGLSLSFFVFFIEYCYFNP